MLDARILSPARDEILARGALPDADLDGRIASLLRIAQRALKADRVLLTIGPAVFGDVDDDLRAWVAATPITSGPRLLDEVLAAEDVTAHPVLSRWEPFAALGLRAALVAPVVWHRSVVLGALVVGFRSRRGWEPTDLDDIGQLGRLAGTAVDAAYLAPEASDARSFLDDQALQTGLLLGRFSPVAVYRTSPDGLCLHVNQRWCDLTGYTAEESWGWGWARSLHPDDAPSVTAAWQAAASQGQLFRMEYRFVRANGSVFWGAVEAVPYANERGERAGYVGMVQDITVRREMEESLARSREALQASHGLLRATFDAISSGVLSVDAAGLVNDTNESLAAVLRAREDGLVGRSAEEVFACFLLPLAADGEAVARWVREVSEAPESEAERVLRAADGRSLRIVTRPQRAAGRVTGRVWVFDDVTDSVRALEDVRRALAEKEVMLKEIHHRVKNNLQVISSLLHMQSRGVDDARAVALFQESEQRVLSMALIHESLYRSSDLSRVAFAPYLEELARILVRSLRVEGGELVLRFDLAPVELTVETAVPCALVANELLTNAVKHAFPGSARGSIELSLRREEGRVTLSVRDDGVGLPPGLEPERSRSLGLRLVRALAGQLHGEARFERASPGTVATLTFDEGGAA